MNNGVWVTNIQSLHNSSFVHVSLVFYKRKRRDKIIGLSICWRHKVFSDCSRGGSFYEPKMPSFHCSRNMSRLKKIAFSVILIFNLLLCRTVGCHYFTYVVDNIILVMITLMAKTLWYFFYILISACQTPLCKLGCQNGFEKDENGCEICKCKGGKAQILISYVRW